MILIFIFSAFTYIFGAAYWRLEGKYSVSDIFFLKIKYFFVCSAAQFSTERYISYIPNNIDTAIFFSFYFRLLIFLL